MKRIIIFLAAALAVVFSLEAAVPEKRMRQIIERCDVSDTVMNAPSAEVFWQLLQSTTPGYEKTARSLAGKKQRDVKRNIISTLSEAEAYFVNVPVAPGSYDLSEAVVNRSGIRSVNPTSILTVTDEPDVAVFSYPNGYFYMTRPLIDILNCDTLAVEALLAAEHTHFALQDAYENACREKSRRRRNNLMKYLCGGALVVGGAILDEVTGCDGMFTDVMAGVGITLLAMPVAQRVTMLYSDEQVHRADIVAYRFMEWKGCSGRVYIDALRRAGFHLEASSAAGNMPAVADRIAVLEYLDSHPEMRAQVKARTRQPRRVAPVHYIFSRDNYR